MEIPINKKIRRNIASTNPIWVARLRSFVASLLEIRVMNRMLSIPKTISKNVRVTRAERASVVKKAILLDFFYGSTLSVFGIPHQGIFKGVFGTVFGF